MQTMQIKETYKFVFKDIDIYVKIDYYNGRISLVEPFYRAESKFSKKSWTFANRGVEYMQGWLDILEAMSEAIKHAKQLLTVYQEAQKEKAIVQMVEMDKALKGKK